MKIPKYLTDSIFIKGILFRLNDFKFTNFNTGKTSISLSKWKKSNSFNLISFTIGSIKLNLISYKINFSKLKQKEIGFLSKDDFG